MKHNRSVFQIGLLTLFSAAYLLIGLGSVKLIDWDENIYAEASRQMVERDNYLNIYINNQSFAEKPPFFFWEMATSFHMFGINEFAARFPSAAAGILMAILMGLVGKRLVSSRFGLFWAIIYLTSLFPSILGRAAVIDHTFNLLISTAFFSLYLFDINYRKARKEKDIRIIPLHWQFLLLASICMGVGVITKGPLGGVIPLIGYGTYKCFNRRPIFRWFHFMSCALLSLGIVSLWYVVNLVQYGSEFIQGFIQFQLSLATTTMEGHTGPWYYHLMVIPIAFLPWSTVFPFFRRSLLNGVSHHIQAILIGGSGWVIFVTVLMSLVKTKLPHYSASVYVPLSFLAAFVLYQWDQRKQTPIPKTFLKLFFISGTLLSGLTIFLPDIMQQAAEKFLIDVDYQWDLITIRFWGAIVWSMFIGSTFLFARRQLLKGVLTAGIAMFLFIQILWQYHLPAYQSVYQQPVVDFVQEAKQNNGRLVMYRVISFAAFFYGQEPIEMLHTSKFKGDPTILTTPTNRPIYVITDRSQTKQLQAEYPNLQFIRKKAAYYLYMRPSSQ